MQIFIQKDYNKTNEQTEMTITEQVGEDFNKHFIFDIKSLSQKDLIELLESLKKYLTENYKKPDWQILNAQNTKYFEDVKIIISEICSYVYRINQEIKMEILIKETEEKTKLLKEAKEKDEKVPRWVSSIGPYTCSEKHESELPGKTDSTLIEEYDFPQ